MADPKLKLTDMLEKQRKLLEAQRAESERLSKEQAARLTDQTVQPSPTVKPAPNK